VAIRPGGLDVLRDRWVCRRLSTDLTCNHFPHDKQTFYFDAAGLQRRMDHYLFGTRSPTIRGRIRSLVALSFQPFGGHLPLEADVTVIAKPSLIDVEIFDAAFE
jgi:hypothetical protein